MASDDNCIWLLSRLVDVQIQIVASGGEFVGNLLICWWPGARPSGDGASDGDLTGLAIGGAGALSGDGCWPVAFSDGGGLVVDGDSLGPDK